MSRDSPGVRWWPVLAIAVLTTGLLARAWLVPDLIRQVRVLRTYTAITVALVLFLVWISAFARLSSRARVSVWAALLLGALAFAGLFRYRGLSGDFEPLFEARFASDAVAPITPGSATLGAPGRDFPQFLGPERNATVSGVRLARDWEARPPRLIWRRAVGGGWSGFAVAGDLAVTQEQHGDDESVVAYALTTGEPRWNTSQGVAYASAIAGDGPRATPTMTADRVYAVSSTGVLSALDRESGELLWRRNILEDAGAPVPEWGLSGSPLLLGDRVVVAGGGRDGRALTAYATQDGAPLWSGGDDDASYASPMLAELAGVPQIVVFGASSVGGYDPENGLLLWSHEWPRQQPNAAQPLVLSGDRLLVSAGYGVGSKLFRIEREEGRLRARLLWETPRLKAKFTNLVVHEGLVYGLDDGVLVCLDPDTGERRWKRGHYGHGQLLLVGELLLVQSEPGEVVLVEPDPERLVELGRFQGIRGKVWNTPALAGSWLLMRNDREAVAYELPLEEEANSAEGTAD